jgi:hypothetical protein
MGRDPLLASQSLSEATKHGLGGDANGTWKKFPELIRADAEIAKLYDDVATAAYDTGFVGSQPSLSTCAQILKTERSFRKARVLPCNDRLRWDCVGWDGWRHCRYPFSVTAKKR